MTGGVTDELAVDWHDRIERFPMDDGTDLTVRTITGLARLPDGQMHFRSYDVPLDADEVLVGRIREWIESDLAEGWAQAVTA